MSGWQDIPQTLGPIDDLIRHDEVSWSDFLLHHERPLARQSIRQRPLPSSNRQDKEWKKARLTCKLPTAENAMTVLTPKLLSAAMLARYGTSCGANSWCKPWRDKKAIGTGLRSLELDDAEEGV